MADTGLTRARRLLGRFARDERGATAIEYALIAVGISVAVATAVFSVGTALNTGFYQRVEAEFNRQ